MAEPKKELFIELEGSVYVVEKEGDKVISKATLDGNVVLNVLLACLSVGLPAFIEKFGKEAQAKAKKASKPKKKAKKK